MGATTGSPAVAKKVVLMLEGVKDPEEKKGIQARLGRSGLVLSKGEQSLFEGRMMVVVETVPDARVKLEETTAIELVPTVDVDRDEEKHHEEIKAKCPHEEKGISSKTVEFDD